MFNGANSDKLKSLLLGKINVIKKIKANITDISDKGLVTIKFNMDMKDIPTLTDLYDKNVLKIKVMFSE